MVHSVIQESAVFMHAALTDSEDARRQMRAFITRYGRGARRQAVPVLSSSGGSRAWPTAELSAGARGSACHPAGRSVLAASAGFAQARAIVLGW
jgi:hypothetical protein